MLLIFLNLLSIHILSGGTKGEEHKIEGIPAKRDGYLHYIINVDNDRANGQKMYQFTTKF